MEDFSADVWQRRGSSVVFDRQTIGRHLESARLVSLRAALSWLRVPSSQPAPRSSVLISGLETALQILPPQEARDFLVRRVRPLIIEAQNSSWDCGLIFGFTAPPQAFTVGHMNEELLYEPHSGHRLRLSEWLWGGGADAVKRLVREASSQNREETLGYYVPRLS
ncbi:MAG: hypothetical protein LBH94_01830 [Deltaproteobacteria bacterium]|jgi:hypothetical protein|nr:hypothetical protein [Deltaproteobacteria bacterium]